MDWETFYNSFRKPDFIPGYEIQNRLGGGAYGDVYKARKQSIGKAYAIKFLKIEDTGQREAVERELDQVRHFAAIDHPNLVTIEDMGRVMEVPYLIMGYAGEDTLARRLKAGPLARDEALLYFTQTCRGVLALHDRRLVHFDLKPSNVFLKGDVARVGDYGLSKLLTDGRTTLSFGRGTPQYMAPEILRHRADHRADLYSLGVILYESLTGELPFRPDTDGGLVLRETDEPPEFPDGFPSVLRPAVERCLRLAPADRFADVGELLEALGQTGRQGDSVRIDWEAAPPPLPPPRSPAPDAPGARKGSSRDDLRQTAADLARGAVEVARGVWQGLRSPRDEAAQVAGELDSAVREVEEAVGAAAEAEEGSVAEPLERVAVGNVRERARSGASGARRGIEEVSSGGKRVLAMGLALGRRPREKAARPQPAPAGGGTVPVPPRVEGGWMGTLVSSGVVAMEVLVAMLGNLVRGLVRAFQVVTGKLLRRSGGWIARSARLIAFLVLMVALGFTVTMAGLAFLNAVGVSP